MYNNLYFIVSSVFLIFLCQSYGQDIAEKQCEKYIDQVEKLKTQKEISKPRRHRRVVGGTKAEPEEFPFMAALAYGDDGNREWSCGGTLISEKFVLIAAQCAQHRQLGSIKLIRLGTTDITLPIGQKPALDIAVKKIHVHPEYAGYSSVYNDIALVELEKTVDFSSSVFPACLNTGSKVNGSVVATGWGKTDFAGEQSTDLLKVTLSIFSSEDCQKAFGSSNRRLKKGIQSDTQICAGGTGSTPKDTCSGDSGGPLLIQNGNKNIIVGITSFGKACGIANTPAVYTRVSAFIPWLESIVWK